MNHHATFDQRKKNADQAVTIEPPATQRDFTTLQSSQGNRKDENRDNREVREQRDNRDSSKGLTQVFTKGALAIKTQGSDNMPKQIQKATTPCAAPMIMNDGIHTPKNKYVEKEKSHKRSKK